MVKLYNAANTFEADQIVALMKDNGIEAYKQGVGASGYMGIIGGLTTEGFDIYVDSRKAERAYELLKILLQ